MGIETKASREMSRGFKNSQKAGTGSGHAREGWVEAFDQGLHEGGLEQAVVTFLARLLLAPCRVMGTACSLCFKKAEHLVSPHNKCVS